MTLAAIPNGDDAYAYFTGTFRWCLAALLADDDPHTREVAQQSLDQYDEWARQRDADLARRVASLRERLDQDHALADLEDQRRDAAERAL